MAEPYLEPVAHPSAWIGRDISSIDEFSFVLQDRHLSALDRALKSVRDRGLELNSLEKGDFDLSDIADDICQIENDILHGRGMVVIRDFPVNEYSLEDIEITSLRVITLHAHNVISTDSLETYGTVDIN